MERENILNLLKKSAEIVDKYISDYLNLSDDDYNILYEAMRYSSLLPGKRLRSFLMSEFYKLFREDITPVLPFACAVEFIHTYSLIHDDLPCMDDGELRRGKPANHKVYGEANALLAGDALLTTAFEMAADNEHMDYPVRLQIIKEMANAAGHAGMIGGQVMDMLYETRTVAIENLIKLSALKTGKMIELSAVIGCLAGESAEEEVKAARAYAYNLGLCFQIIDDILDLKGNTEELGKNTGQDAVNGKSTFALLLGIDKAYKYAEDLTKEAINALKIFSVKGRDCSDLISLAEYLLNRDK